jgi:hypothetical protein
VIVDEDNAPTCPPDDYLRLPFNVFGQCVRSWAKNRKGVFRNCPLEYSGAPSFEIPDAAEWKCGESFEERTLLRSLFSPAVDKRFKIDQNIGLFGTLPQSLQYETNFSFSEFYFGIFDLKYVPRGLWAEPGRPPTENDDTQRIISYLFRAVCAKQNSHLTTDPYGEDGSADKLFNFGPDRSLEFVNVCRALCRSSYTETKGNPDFDCSKDEVSWTSFLRSKTFEYFSVLAGTVDYCHEDTRYVNLFSSAADISLDLHFLLDYQRDRPEDSITFDLLHESKQLAHSLNRLREMSRCDAARNTNFAALAYIRKYLVSFVQAERDRIRKVLCFTDKEANLVFNTIDMLSPSEIRERNELLESHRGLRRISIANHK